jgi:Domain of unknown function (DUF4410)
MRCRSILAPATRRGLRVLALLVGMAALVGCASSGGGARAVEKSGDITRFKSLAIQTSVNKALKLSAPDQERIVQLVQGRIRERDGGRFASVGAAPDDPAALQVKIGFTRYEEGSALARFMLMGLGEIRIDADVVLVDPATQAVLGRYVVTKTVAWGGIHGGATTIRDVEIGFADAVADIVLGEAD